MMPVNRQALTDDRFWCLITALLLMLLLFIYPKVKLPLPVYTVTFIVGITRSMSTEDYR